MNESIKNFIKNILNFNLENDFIFIKNEDFKYVFANTKFCELFNINLNDLIEKNDSYLFEDNSYIEECKKTDILALRNNFHISNETIGNQVFRVLKLKIKLNNSNIGILCLAKFNNTQN